MEDGAEKFIPRGIRNNNPGNIKKNKIEWDGLVSEEEQKDNTFFIFKSPEFGIRALTKILITYRKTHDLYNIWGITNRYAPPFENNTEAYKNLDFRSTPLTNTDYCHENSFYIGCYPGINREMINFILKIFEEFFKDLND